MGVSAGHLDWTMVPYVRKSFVKHFNDGIQYLYEAKPYTKEVINRLSKLSIEDNHYNQFPKAKKYAIDKITSELKQAVEAMFHNLNTLQSRSGETGRPLI